MKNFYIISLIVTMTAMSQSAAIMTAVWHEAAHENAIKTPTTCHGINT
jgi:hypothetical protein